MVSYSANVGTTCTREVFGSVNTGGGGDSSCEQNRFPRLFSPRAAGGDNPCPSRPYISPWAVQPVVDALLIERVQVQGQGNVLVGHLFRDRLLDEDDLAVSLLVSTEACYSAKVKVNLKGT